MLIKRQNVNTARLGADSNNIGFFLAAAPIYAGGKACYFGRLSMAGQQVWKATFTGSIYSV
ncbi:hypothetical protein RNAN_1718 [Rheinheimera nanhaiensis E407-8]|uniref:Uncharacterized protein n=1 Tax=Rheinheimera nanhaiensis E407-8 TaxID=562729 RepID=I1DXF2_9GAMM|nr:hypothetical protein RNAN_1718 [Rheinheimera nanhaiensis E407-8]